MRKKSTNPTFKEEEKLWEKGFNYVIGLDEVGRGAFAGPVAVASVVFPKKIPQVLAREINDSKLLSHKKRLILSPLIKKHAIAYSICLEGVKTINKHGIGYATKKAFRKSIAETNSKLLKNNNKNNTFILIDGFHIKYVRDFGIKNQKAIIKGDRVSLSIAAASIIAKVHRDLLMETLGKKYPRYKWHENKGYGTRKHREAIKKYGLCLFHRSSFKI